MSDVRRYEPIEISERITMQLESPDLVWFRPRGTVNVDDLTKINTYYEQHIRDWPHVFLFIDSREKTGSISPEGRKAASTLYHWVPFRGTAIIGGSMTMRVIGQLLMKVIGSLSSKSADNPTIFVDTEEEARAWLRQRREAIGAPAVP